MLSISIMFNKLDVIVEAKEKVETVISKQAGASIKGKCIYG